MKGIVCIFLFAVVATALARPHDPNEKYSNKFDNVKLKEILENDRLVSTYVECLLGDIKKCTAEGKELKSHIKDALETECDKCTDRQKEGTEETIAFLINEKPELWNKLVDKYDPDRKYSVKYEARLKKVTKKH